MYSRRQRLQLGYNSIEPVEFTIHAEYDKTSDDPKLTKLESLGTLTFTADKTAGTLSTDVVNNKGFTLPETGGMVDTSSTCWVQFL